MYDHIGIKVKNLDASVRFYEAVLAPLGFVLCSRDANGAGLGPKDAPALWLSVAEQRHAESHSGTHIAFRAKNHDAVQGFYKRALESGGKDNGKPGPRPDYSPTYYAAFVIDPDGNNVEAVCV